MLWSVAHFFVFIFFPRLGFCVVEEVLRNRLMKIVCVSRTNPGNFQFKFLVFCGVAVRQVDSEPEVSSYPEKSDWGDVHLGGLVDSLTTRHILQIEFLKFILCHLFSLPCCSAKVSLKRQEMETEGLSTQYKPLGSIMYSWGPSSSTPPTMLVAPNGR